MKSIRNGLPAFFAAAALVVAMAWHSTAHAQATAQSAAGLSDPCPVKGEDWRGKAFYEILFMNR
jgi:hypothetical protein